MLKESLIGWGGINYKEEKVILDNQKVYMRVPLSYRTEYVHGPFHRWTRKLFGVDTFFDTVERYPSVGDTTYSENNRGIVYSVTDENTIYISSPEFFSESSTIQKCTYVGETDESVTYANKIDILRVYPVNIDGTETNTYFDIETTNTFNERYYFDKETQCIVRIAMNPTYGKKFTGELGDSEKDFRIIDFDLYNPNTGEHLDHHRVYGYSKQSVNTLEAGYVPDFYSPNCSQGLYCVYLSGSSRVIYLYRPKIHRVFEIKDNISYASYYSSGTSAVTDKFLGAYNTSTDLDDLTNIIMGLYLPVRSGLQMFFNLYVNLETNPVTVNTDYIYYLSPHGDVVISSGEIAYNFNQNNYLRVNIPFHFYNARMVWSRILFSCDAEFFDSPRSVYLMEPESPSDPGYMLKMIYEGVGTTVYFQRIYRDSNGNLTTVTTDPIELPVDTKVRLSWNCDEGNGTTTYYESISIYNYYDQTSTRVYYTTDNFFVYNTQDSTVNYIFRPEYLKLYLETENFQFLILNTGSSLSDAIGFSGYRDPDPIEINTVSQPQQFAYEWDHYPKFPYTGWSSIYADDNNIFSSSITYSTEVLVSTSLGLTNYSFREEFHKNSLITSTSGSLSDYTSEYSYYTRRNNLMGSFHEGFYLPRIYNSEWNGNLVQYTEFGWQTTSTNTQKLYILGTTPSTYPTISTSDYWPRLYTGPKCIQKAAELTEAGEVFEINGITYYKNNSDLAHGGFMKAKIAANTRDNVLVGFVIVSETEDGAKCYSSEDSTPTIGGSVTYKGKTYYYYAVPFKNSGSKVQDDTYTNYGLTEYYLHGTASTGFTPIPLLMAIIGNQDYESVLPSTLIKDAYSANGVTNGIVYKLLYGVNNKQNNTYDPDINTLSLYDMNTGQISGDISYSPLTIAPCSERIQVLTSNNNTSDYTWRYINVISTEFENGVISSPVVRVDCYRNTKYLSDLSMITRNISIFSKDGGTAIPPVCVTSGDVGEVTLTINPDPADATVTFSTGEVSGNTCTVKSGTVVTYTVSKEHYLTKTATVSVGYTQTLNVGLILEKFVLTVNPDPGDATVTFSTGEVSGNTCVVDYNTTVTYTVQRTSFTPITQTLTITENTVVYPYMNYVSGTEVFVSSTANTSTDIFLRPGNTYTIDLVGSGGGGYNWSFDSISSGYQNGQVTSGGSGSWVNATITGNRLVHVYLGSPGAARRDVGRGQHNSAGSGGSAYVDIYEESTGQYLDRITAGGGIGGGYNNKTPAGGSTSCPSIPGVISTISGVNGNPGYSLSVVKNHTGTASSTISPWAQTNGGSLGNGGDAYLKVRGDGTNSWDSATNGITGLIKIVAY